jgi:hypothetical protein
MSNRIITVLEKVSKLKDIFEWEVQCGRYFVCYKTSNDRKDSFQFKDENDSELWALESDVARIEYINGEQRNTDEKTLHNFVEQYRELAAHFPDVKIYSAGSTCREQVFAEIDHGDGRRVVKKLQD